jgi:hypothetical protein
MRTAPGGLGVGEECKKSRRLDAEEESQVSRFNTAFWLKFDVGGGRFNTVTHTSQKVWPHVNFSLLPCILKATKQLPSEATRVHLKPNRIPVRASVHPNTPTSNIVALSPHLKAPLQREAEVLRGVEAAAM